MDELLVPISDLMESLEGVDVDDITGIISLHSLSSVL